MTQQKDRKTVIVFSSRDAEPSTEICLEVCIDEPRCTYFEEGLHCCECDKGHTDVHFCECGYTWPNQQANTEDAA